MRRLFWWRIIMRFYQAVVDGRADAMVSDKIEVELQVRNLRNGTLCMVNDVPWTFEELGYLLPRDQVLKNFVDTWVRSQVEGGICGMRYWKSGWRINGRMYER
jgi:ABC-type amino acid transport substrate-binding protein